ncbi:exonuclease subunit SbcC [Staphylococcus americanisciuri]|uniref:Nuclease SbcCD subunit C n=1 Tax=Staphylococcus americanisciuri TaxID=2973940 RepID=A0ABT2EYW7_9STAP|nr:exonuclease subunit SbcC [Staphylococcus americanisciuri]MCS4485369.1 SMC family ATPase [Staphylococcus americanisciuri]
MKPISLHLENFGPFVDEVIDFSKIHDNQLFLISGKTGSGKTMIFDGIVFALYGQASTEKREVKDLRSQFADPKKPLKVTFEFEVCGKRYKVIRTAAFTKPGNKSETNPTLEVYVYDGKRYVLTESKLNEGRQYLLTLLQLKQDQFRQLFILPQGEFKRFLVSKTTDKQTILRTLFNTQLYEYLSRELHTKTKDIKEDIEKRQIRIKEHWSNLATFDNEMLQGYQSLTSEQHDRLLEVLPLYQTIGQKVVRELEEATNQMNDKVQKLKKQKAQQEERIELEKEYQKYINEIEELEAEKPKIRQLEAQLNRITESKVAVRLYQDQTNACVQLSQYEKQVQRFTASLAMRQQDLNALQEQQGQLTAKEEAIAKQRTFVENTRYFYQNESQYQASKEKRQRDKQDLASLDKKLHGFSKEYDDLKLSLNGQEVDFNKENELSDQLLVLSQEVEAMKQAQKYATKAAEFKQAITKTKAIIQELKATIAEKQQQVHHITSHDQVVLNHEAAVHILRDTLKSGEPCPVCRQIVHNSVDGSSVADLKLQQEQNEVLEKEIQDAREQVIENQTSLKYYEQAYEEVADVVFDNAQFDKKQREVESMTKARDTLRASNQHLVKVNQRIEKLEKTINQVKNEMTLKSQQLSKYDEALEQFEKQTGYTDIQKFVAAYAERLKKIKDYDEEVRTLQEKIQQTEREIDEETSQRKTARAFYEKEQDKIKQLKIELQTELTRLKLKDIDDLKQVISEVPLEVEIKDKISHHNKAYHLSLNKQSEIQQKLEKIEVLDVEVLETDCAELTTVYNETLKQFNQAEMKLKDNEEKCHAIKKQIQQLKGQLETQSELVNLSEILTGNNHKKLSLENYVLTYYLDQILIQANKRLLNMTGNRYQLVRGEKRGNGYSGLEIAVFDYYANQSRAITSLSGGETFQASLALALGLSEIVQNEQGGISLDAMFVDEGFGTLDQETLETALDTLIQLQSSGRLVGIISHVTELKERIPVVLEVLSDNYQSHTKLLIRE